MLNKYFFLVLLTITSLFASNKAFNEDVKKYLENDFYKYGILYDKENSKISFIEKKLIIENGEAKLSKPFTMIIDSFFPKYLEIILKHKLNIKEIIVTGNISSVNNLTESDKNLFDPNQILSQKAANLFIDYTLQMNNLLIQDNIIWIKNNFLIKKGIKSNVIYNENSIDETDGSRRIEIEIVFKNKLEDIVNKKYSDKKELGTYIQRLLKESSTLKEKFNLLKAFEEDIKIAQAAFNPTITLNAKYSDYKQSTPDNFSDILSKDITFRYNIFNGFKDLEEKNIKQYNYESNEYLNEQIEGDLIYSLVEAFINIKKQKDTLELAKLNLADYDLWIEKEDIKFQNGMISLRNYAKIQSRDTTQRMNYREINKLYKDTISTFRRYLDFDKEDIEHLESLYPQNKYLDNKELAYIDIKQYSPFLKEAEKNIQIYNERLVQSKVNFYPIVNLIAKKNVLDENYESIKTVTTRETSIALEASLELYSGGKDSANHAKKVFEYREKKEKKESILRDLKYKLDLAFNRFELTLEKEELLKNLIKKREDSLLGASYDYKFTKIDANGLLDTVDDLYIAKKMFIENKYDKLLSQYKILNVIGTLKSSLLEIQKKDVN